MNLFIIVLIKLYQYKIKGLISRQEIHLSQYTMIPLSNVYKLNAKSLDDLFTDEDDLENLFDYLQEQFEDIQIEDLKTTIDPFLQINLKSF